MKVLRPGTLVRCSDPVHKENPQHQPWILGRDGYTYCAVELGRLRGGPVPQKPQSTALMRVEKEMREGSECAPSGGDASWERHLQDLVTREPFTTPVQAENGESYEYAEFHAMMRAMPDFVDARNPVPLARPAKVYPNYTLQAVCAARYGFAPQAHPYTRAQATAEESRHRIEEARTDYEALRALEACTPLAYPPVAFRLNDFGEQQWESLQITQPHWRESIAQAVHTTDRARALGVALEAQAEELAARGPEHLSSTYAAACNDVVLTTANAFLGLVLYSAYFCAEAQPEARPRIVTDAVLRSVVLGTLCKLLAQPLALSTLPIEGGAGKTVRDALFLGDRFVAARAISGLMATAIWLNIGMAIAGISAMFTDLPGLPIVATFAALGAYAGEPLRASVPVTLDADATELVLSDVP